MKRWDMGRVGHPTDGQRYCEVNSKRGVLEQAAMGRRWVDLDGNPVWNNYAQRWETANVHDRRPLMHGFHDPQHRLRDSIATTSMSIDEIKRLRADPGNYLIRLMLDQLATAARAGVNVLEELKYAPQFELVGLHRREAAAVRRLQRAHPGFRVIVAILSTHPRAVEVAKAAKAAGRTTCLLAHTDYPAPWREHFDYVRGDGKAVPVR